MLEDVANMIRDGNRVVVKDATTGKDLTRFILTQIILEAEGKDNNPLLPLSFLEALIGLYGNGINHFLLPKFLEQSIKTFENSTHGFENYLDKLFDDVPGGNPMHYPLMSPLKDMNNMNRKLLSINKEIMRNSMQMMMGEGWSPSFEKEMFPEDNDNMAISQKRLRNRLLKRGRIKQSTHHTVTFKFIGGIAMRLAVNGFGRIGRLVTRIFIENQGKWNDIELVAINSTASHQQSLHMLKYDTSHGTMTTKMSSDSTALHIHDDGKADLRVALLSQRDPTQLPWQDLGVDMVLECSGQFNSKSASMAHIESGASHVLISAPAKKRRFNSSLWRKPHRVFNIYASNLQVLLATTNCLAPLVQKFLTTVLGSKNGFATTIHAITNDQITVDAPP